MHRQQLRGPASSRNGPTAGGDLPGFFAPEFFDPENAASWSHEADPAAVQAAAAAFVASRTAAPSTAARTCLLLIDVQRDFCLPRGSLFVGGRSGSGAVEDSVHICRFLYRNLLAIDEVVCTLDTHAPQQIFFASFWQAADGGEVTAGREVTSRQIAAGELRPRRELADWLCSGDVEWLNRQVLDYCRRLESEGRYRLFLWPEHCLLGSVGHALVGVVQEARLYHSYVRGAPAPLIQKGSDPLTESYSVFRSEVRQAFDGSTIGHRNEALIDDLLSRDLIVVAGQAASHCVRASLDDLLAEAQRRGGDLARKIVVLEDCMSSVVLRAAHDPEQIAADFTPQAQEALQRWRAAGVQIGRSRQRVEEWL